MSDRWCVWLGPEVEGTQQGERRLFVHELPTATPAQVLAEQAAAHQVRTLYFCAEHVERHGLAYVALMLDYYKCVVCLWPQHLARHLAWLRTTPARLVLEIGLPDWQPHEVKLVSRPFVTRCIDVERMPATKPSVYDVDVPLMLHPSLGQQRIA
jgi:hypothetical protein